MTWFLFGNAGVPVLLAIIQRTGFAQAESKKKGIFYRGGETQALQRKLFVFLDHSVNQIKEENDWVHDTGDKIVSAFVLPPLQIVAACINFCTLIISVSHLFELPFKSYNDILQARALLLNAKSAVRADDQGKAS